MIGPLISVLEGPLADQEDDFLDSIHSRVVWGLDGGDKKAVMTNIEAVIKTKTAGSKLTNFFSRVTRPTLLHLIFSF